MSVFAFCAHITTKSIHVLDGLCVCVSERSILIIFAHDKAKMTISRIDRQHEQQIR